MAASLQHAGAWVRAADEPSSEDAVEVEGAGLGAAPHSPASSAPQPFSLALEQVSKPLGETDSTANCALLVAITM